jgi:hypothetical protein
MLVLAKALSLTQTKLLAQVDATSRGLSSRCTEKTYTWKEPRTRSQPFPHISRVVAMARSSPEVIGQWLPWVFAPTNIAVVALALFRLAETSG